MHAIPAPTSPVATGANFAHLGHLGETVTIDGRPSLLVSIYAEAPSYAPVGDADEGIACVDDVARAAVLYLDQHHATGDRAALDQARSALNFISHMQAPDGTFYNFVTDKTGTINTTGPTSHPGLGWWTYRGMWALGKGVAELRDIDPAMAGELRTRYLRAEDALARNTDAAIAVGRSPIPDGAVDAASVAVLALAEFQAAEPNARTKATLETLAGAVAASRVDAPGTSWMTRHVQFAQSPETWHAWGAHAAQALARAGEVLGRKDLLDSASRELNGVLGWQLAAGRIHEMTPLPTRDGQQVYGVNCAVQAAMTLNRVTGDDRYAKMAGLHASWLTGNNMARRAMYDPATGRGYDGFRSHKAVNTNSGAESTIEALMALQAVSTSPTAQRYMQLTPVREHTWKVANAQGGVAHVSGVSPGKYELLARYPTGSGLVHAGSVELTSGDNVLKLPRSASAVLVHPVIAGTELVAPDGAHVVAAYDLAAGHLTLTERR